jgi:hypothetical protein
LDYGYWFRWESCKLGIRATNVCIWICPVASRRKERIMDDLATDQKIEWNEGWNTEEG